MVKETLTEQIALSELDAKSEKPEPKQARWLTWAAENGIFVFTAILVVFAVVFIDGFASLINIADVLHRAAPLGIVAVGMTFVVISGNYLDLSVVAQIATSAVIFVAVSNEYNIPVAMLAALVAALFYGVVNGVAVGISKQTPSSLRCQRPTSGSDSCGSSPGINLFGPPDGPIATFGSSKIGPVPYSAIVLVIMAILLQILLDPDKLRLPSSLFRRQRKCDEAGWYQHGACHHRRFRGYCGCSDDCRVCDGSVLEHRCVQ